MLDSLANVLIDRLRVALAHRFTIEHELGRGGMGTVFLARDLKHSRHVALKVLHPELASSVGAERFLREIRTAAGLAHPNIVAVFESGEADGMLYYVMPFIAGESLRARLTRERRLPVDEAVRIATDVAAALDYAHTAGIIHRDIKPENILLPNRAQAVVADFGLAHAVSLATSPRLTATGITVGSPLYMSPEQALADRDLDGRADVYSLGCVVFEMLAGRPPFEAKTQQAVLAQHVMQKPPTLRSIRADVTSDLQDAVCTAMEKSAEQRFGTAHAFAEALEAAAQTRTAPASDDGSSKAWLREWLRSERRTLRRAGILAACIVAGVAAWLVWHARQPVTGAQGAPNPADRIAVLYFEDHSAGGELRYLADALTENLIQQLRPLDVISENGVAPYRNRAIGVDSIASALKVGALITGSVARSGDRLRVNVRLIDARTGNTLRNDMVERAWGDPFGLVDDVVTEVSRLLREELGRAVRIEKWQSETASPDAWKLVYQSEEVAKNAEPLWRSGDMAALSTALQSADSLLMRAEAADPRWVQPHVTRAWLARRRGFVALFPAHHDLAKFRKAISDGLSQADSAHQINPNDARPFEVRGMLRTVRLALDPAGNSAVELRRDSVQRDSAQADFERAVAIDPRLARSWNELSRMHLEKGQFAEAKFAAEKANAADAFLENANETLDHLFTASFELGDDAQASHWCEELHRRAPADQMYARCALTLLGWSDDIPADPQKAWSIVDASGARDAPELRALMRPRLEVLAAGVLVRAGKPDSARAVLARARANDGQDADLLPLEAAVRTLLHEPAEAARLLGEYQQKQPERRKLVLQSRRFRALGSNPEFKALSTPR